VPPAIRSTLLANPGLCRRINIRKTRITTFDGESVIIPDRDVYKNVILVPTHHDTHRLQFDIGIAYDNDAEQATRAIVQALSAVPGVVHDPPPEALVYELGVSTVNIRALPADIVALQATPSFRAALHGDARLTPEGNLRPNEPGSNGTPR